MEKRSVAVIYATRYPLGGNNKTGLRLASLLNENGFSSVCLHVTDILDTFQSRYQCDATTAEDITAVRGPPSSKAASLPSSSGIDGASTTLISAQQDCMAGVTSSTAPLPIADDASRDGGGGKSWPTCQACGRADRVKVALQHQDSSSGSSDSHKSTSSCCMSTECCALQHYCIQNSVSHVIAIHAYRCHKFLDGSSVPYTLVFGGTDINVDSYVEDMVVAMTPVVGHARHVVCFTQAMFDRAAEVWPAFKGKLVIQGNCVAIAQPVPSMPCPPLVEWIRSLPDSSRLAIPDNATVFLLVAGIRPVKDPLYLVDAMDDWHMKDTSVFMVIIGTVLDEEYYATLQNRLARSSAVMHADAVDQAMLHGLMRQCFAVVNTSRSEGMCQALLEAMVQSVPVIGRDIPGNRSFITHSKTGLLFNSPQVFVECAKRLRRDDQFRTELVAAAAEHCSRHYNEETLVSLYCRLVGES